MGPADDDVRAGAAVGMQPDVVGRGQLAGRDVALGVTAAQQGKTVVTDEELHVARQGRTAQGPQRHRVPVGLPGLSGGVPDTAQQGFLPGRLHGGQFGPQHRTPFRQMFKATLAAPGRMEQAFHIVPHAAPHIQLHGLARRVPVAFLRRRQHQLRCAEIRRPAPQPGLQQQAVLTGGAHAQQALLFLVQLGQQLFQLAQTARQGQGRGTGGVACGLFQYQLLPGLLHQAEDVFPLLLVPALGQGVR